MNAAKKACFSVLVSTTVFGISTAHAANTGYIEAWLNTDSCAYLTSPANNKISTDIKIKPVLLEKKYTRGKDDFYIWKLNTQKSTQYTCHDPKSTPGGGFLEFNYFLIHNDVGGWYSNNKLVDSLGNTILSQGASTVDSWVWYYPPDGFKAYSGYPGTTTYTLQAEAYWVFGGGGEYAKLNINIAPD